MARTSSAAGKRANVASALFSAQPVSAHHDLPAAVVLVLSEETGVVDEKTAPADARNWDDWQAASVELEAGVIRRRRMGTPCSAFLPVDRGSARRVGRCIS